MLHTASCKFTNVCVVHPTHSDEERYERQEAVVKDGNLAHRFGDDYQCEAAGNGPSFRDVARNLCRIETVLGTHIGTGWLISMGLTKQRGFIITNRHVARRFQLRPDVPAPPEKQAYANFRANPSNGATVDQGRYALKLEDMDYNEVDVAIFSLVHPPQGLTGLDLWEGKPPRSGEECRLIGYPGKDLKEPLFCDVYGVLRLSPGEG